MSPTVCNSLLSKFYNKKIIFSSSCFRRSFSGRLEGHVEPSRAERSWPTSNGRSHLADDGRSYVWSQEWQQCNFIFDFCFTSLFSWSALLLFIFFNAYIPSIIRCQDSNARPLSCKSFPLTDRLPITPRLLF